MSSVPSGPEAIKAMRKLMQEGNHSNPWDETWKANITPWDRHGSPQPPLIELFSSKAVSFPSSGKAIVPGCGRGYDALFLALQGYESVGVDISPTAVKAAREWLEKQPQSEASSRTSFKELDFFAFKPSEAEQFDIAYDYTFVVILFGCPSLAHVLPKILLCDHTRSTCSLGRRIL
jgi:methyl halide transferase